MISLEIGTCPFEDFEIRVPASRLGIATNGAMKESGISIYQNLSLSVENQKQIKFRKLTMSPLLNGSSNTHRFCSFFSHTRYSKRMIAPFFLYKLA